MTEEEFWHTNPRKIKVYEEAWKAQQNQLNTMAFTIWGQYGMSALITALSGVLTPMFCGKQSNIKYLEEPVRIFEMTEQEKKEYEAQQTEAFVAWCESMKKDWEESHESDN